jgi:HPr kinase/phosphorylase
MFGVESIKQTQNVDLIINLEVWGRDGEYERFGLDDEFMEILGNRVTCHTIPIRPGRNLSVICESAAINHRQKKMGYNAAKELNKRANFDIS